MARFKVSGNLYVSQWGGLNANAGTDPNLPKETIASGASVAGTVLVIGAGVYKENNFGAVAKNMIGDGKVIIDGLNGNLGMNNTTSWKNIWFKNITSLGHTNSANFNTDNIYENVLGHNSPGNTWRCDRCIIAPSSGTLTTISSSIFQSCIIIGAINLPAVTNNVWSGSFISKNVIFTVLATETFAIANFRDACVNGKISRNGILYELKQNWDGSARADADAGVLDLITVYPNVYVNGNFACVDPEFVDIYSKTVLPTSPLLKRAFGGYYVGAVRAAQIIRLDNPNFEFAYTGIDTTNPLAVATSAGQPYGQIRITGKISDFPSTFSVFSLRTILSFWKGAAGGTVENNNVPDAVRLLGLAAGDIDKPRRLTYLMRTSLSTAANQASADAIWDNDGAGVAGDYLLMEDGTIPTHAAFGGSVYGNGDPRAIGAPLSAFNFCSIDVIVILDQERD